MWLIVRLFGIVAGVASLVRLATQWGLVQYNQIFQEWMDRLRDLVELGIPLDLLEVWLVVPLMEVLRTSGIHLPELQPQWRPVFVLSWLLLFFRGRHSLEVSPWIPGLTHMGMRNVFFFARTANAFVSSLIAGLLAGVLQPGSWGLLSASFAAVACYSALGWAAYYVLDAAIPPKFERGVGLSASWNPLAKIAGFSVGLMVLVAISYLFATNQVLGSWRSPLSFLVIAAFVAFEAFRSLLLGILPRRDIIKEDGFFRHTVGAIGYGLDVLGLMGSALVIAVLMADPPIW